MYGTIITAVSPAVLKLIAIGALLAAILGGGFYIHHQGYKSGFATAEAEGKNTLEQYKSAQRKAYDAAVLTARKAEDDLQTKLLQGQVEKEIEIKAINDAHDGLIVRLRERAPRNKPAAGAPSPNPTVAAPECAGTGSTGASLSREDGEFLVGEATGAEVLKQALKACRAAYRNLLTIP